MATRTSIATSATSYQTDARPHPTAPVKAAVKRVVQDERQPQVRTPAATAPQEQGILSRYLTELVEHRVLTPEEEVGIAREVETLEIAYWLALLSEPRAFEAIMQACGSKMDPVPKPAQSLWKLARTARSRALTPQERKRWERVSGELAVIWRKADVERTWVQEAYEAVLELGRLPRNMRRSTRGTPVRVLNGAALKTYLARIEKARRAQLAVKHRFAAANLRLVVTMARRYRDGRMPLEDVIQEGNFGLLKAVERFDHRLGFRFSTYASWWIRHHITRALADKGRVVRIPVHLLETHQRVSRIRRKLEAQTGVTPDDARVREEAGLTAEQLSMVEEGAAAMSIFSLDVGLGNEDDSSRFVDLLVDEEASTPDEHVETNHSSHTVARLLETLPPMEAHILRWRFGLDGHEELTLREIGLRYNLSRERIRQIQVQALDKLQRALKQQERGAADEDPEGVDEASAKADASTRNRGSAKSGRDSAPPAHATAC